MAFLAKVKKDLRVLAEEMGLVLGQGLKNFEITEQILQAPQYKEEMVKPLLSNIIEDRKSKEEKSKLDREREFKLQKLTLNIEAQKNCIENGITPTTDDENILNRDMPSNKKNAFSSKTEISRHPPFTKSRFSPRNDKTSADAQDRRSVFTCYECGEPGVIKSRCPKCSPSSTHSSPRVRNVLHVLTVEQVIVLLENCYTRFSKQRGAGFQKTQLTMSLADGTKNEVEAYTTCVDVGLEGKVIKTNLIALSLAKENRTLLGTDFLKDDGVVLILKDRNWYFNDFPRRKFEFAEDATACNVNTMTTESNSCQLREDESHKLSNEEKR
ncbi:retrovirus-related Pol polyprotein from transposon 17.6 [Nephila pilipes]|uniref:Retrovirus-related Pol polyprotein from transposon 17.6 n=1 Tax=Nephila pilipes TaxID=299642 RepID=A0A8X6THV6_NEPPI|nr:retrovirus-related Pol polyprotein from transposon 17.6 [Nephila pilipes]GFT11455.1 retrovirus-related Pol polyprotein from transposon 17.6 [Nephila pilipes]